MQFPTAWAKTDDEYMQKTEDLMNEYAGNPFINVWLAPHAPYTGFLSIPFKLIGS